MLFTQDTHGNIHTFWQTARQNDYNAAKEALEAYQYAVAGLGDSTEDTNKKQAEFTKATKNCNQSLLEGIDISQDQKKQLDKLNNNYASGKGKVASYSGALKSMGSVAKSVGATL